MRLLCVTSVKNEAPFLLEWIAHHRGAGVSDFLIYSNDCIDGTHELLQTLDQAGVITHVPQEVEGKTSPQWQALRAAWKHPLRKVADWALVCDIDEFINIHCGKHTFADLIANVPESTEAIALPWRLFGNNNRRAFVDAPVTEQFTKCAPVDCLYPIAATQFKTLFRTNGRFNQFGIHRPKQKNIEKHGAPHWVNGSGDTLPDILAANDKRLSLYGLPNGRALAECNHYSLKSIESFLIKRARGLPNRVNKKIDLAYWVERNFNSVTNETIKQMAPATKLALDQLREIPTIDEQHDAAVVWHKTKFAELVTQASEQTLASQLMIAGDSKSPNVTDAQRIVGWYHDVATNEVKK